MHFFKKIVNRFNLLYCFAICLFHFILQMQYERKRERDTRKHIRICSDFIKSQYIELISLLYLSWWMLFEGGFHFFFSLQLSFLLSLLFFFCFWFRQFGLIWSEGFNASICVIQFAEYKIYLPVSRAWSSGKLILFDW